MVVLLAIAFLLSVNKNVLVCAPLGLRWYCKLPSAVLCSISRRENGWLNRPRSASTKVMSYSDAGSAFYLRLLVGPKWMCCLTGQGLSSPSGCSRPSFCDRTISLLYYIGVMGLLIRILGGIFQKALNISKIESFVAVTTIFLGQKRDPGNRETVY